MASLLILFFFIFFSDRAVSQQPYVGKTTTECWNPHNSSSALGYFCNGLKTTCRSFLTFRSTPPYNTVASISTLLSSDPSELSAINSVSETSAFDTNKLVLVPINCSCSEEGFYQSNTSYTVVKDDTYFIIANTTFQSLTTCQAIGNQSGNPPARELDVGQRIAVPLRCACPTKNQTDLGFEYLLSYLVAKNDIVAGISERFGVTIDSILEANTLSVDSTINFFTTLLVPLENPPTSNQTFSPPPPPPPPPPVASSPPPGSSDNKTWLYALLGAIGGVGFVLILGAIVYIRVSKERKKKKKLGEANDNVLASESFKAIEKPVKKKKEEYSEEFLELLSDVAQSIKVYNFEELEKATSGFSPSCLIKGAVFRGLINGDLAAIKKVDGDVSKEISLLQKINHSNVIRLSGVSFDQGFWYLVYEYASNGPLSDWIYNGKRNIEGKFLTWTQRIQIALDVATGLNYLHSFANPSHVHKDIKSGNILLDTDFRAKIANFGLARSTTAQGGQDGHFALTKHIVGTVGYMAPEYLDHGLVSKELDVYAFGVLLLEMLTGKEASVLCQENRDLSDAFSGVISGEGQEDQGLSDFVDASMGDKYPSDLVGFVVRIVDGCLKKNPEARPTMEEIVQLLSITLSNSLTWELSKGS